MPAALAAPAGPPSGAVIVAHEAFGLTGHIVDVTRRFADAGWLAIAPSLFHRQGSPTFDYGGSLADLLPVLRSLTASGIDADLRATLDLLARHDVPAGATGIVGFCMGGSVALHAARTLPLGAAVTFYGGGVAEARFGLGALVDLAPELWAPWLGLYGDLDAGIPVEEVEALRAAAATAAVETDVVRYADAEHGFHCDERPSHHPQASADAWARALAWFDRHLAS